MAMISNKPLIDYCRQITFDSAEFVQIIEENSEETDEIVEEFKFIQDLKNSFSSSSTYHKKSFSFCLSSCLEIYYETLIQPPLLG